MSDELLEKIYDNDFKEKIETHLSEFIKNVLDIKYELIRKLKEIGVL